MEGRGHGHDVFDSDYIQEAALDVDCELGFRLSRAGQVLDRTYLDEDEEEEDFGPIFTIEDTADHLNECGHFDRLFELLKTNRRHYELIVFILLSMKVGANISKAQMKHVKIVYKRMPSWRFCCCGCKAQIVFALKEYKSGKPYKLRKIDPEFEKHPVLSSDSEDLSDKAECNTKSESGKAPKKGKKRKRRCEDNFVGEDKGVEKPTNGKDDCEGKVDEDEEDGGEEEQDRCGCCSD